MNRCARFSLIIISVIAITGSALAQYNPESFSAMKWRLVGPHRGGRVTCVAGIPGKPAVYYFGTPGGGVWQTTTGGRVWKPIFDDAHVASIGALALAPSNPQIIYVGTGEETAGNGLYKSTDGGKTWTEAGLKDTSYITAILVDPHDRWRQNVEQGLFQGRQDQCRRDGRGARRRPHNLCRDFQPGDRSVAATGAGA
jgi:hypothetical protein